MSSRNDADGIATRQSTAERQKSGPKGMVMEPYANEILYMAREGKSMQCIATWLAQAPRGVAITRQAVHQWIKARVRKLKRLNVEFAETGLSAPFRNRCIPVGGLSPSVASGLDPPRPGGKQSAFTIDAPTLQANDAADKGKSHDMSKFLVTAAELERSQNVFKSN